MGIDVPARVEQFGIDAYRAGMARFENPYVGFAEMSSETAVADAVAQILMDAWWRGWDRAASESPLSARTIADAKTGGVDPTKALR